MSKYNIYKVSIHSRVVAAETHESVIAQLISQKLREYDCDDDDEFKLVAINDSSNENSAFHVAGQLCSTLEVNSTSAAEWTAICLNLMEYAELMSECLSYLERTFHGLQVDYEIKCQKLKIPIDFIFINIEEYRDRLEFNIENLMNFIRSKYCYQTI